MPMKSEAQRRYLHAYEPEVASEFEAETDPGAQLPERLHAPKRDDKRRKRDAVRRAMSGQGPSPESGIRYAQVG